ncbi:MAG: hypothetical protein IAE89_09785 [Anaerolineae bacterium]|nr:hypothetical protein [Anaerolineae bacterium]
MKPLLNNKIIDDPLSSHIEKEFYTQELIRKLCKVLVDSIFANLPIEGSEAAFYARQIAELVTLERQIEFHRRAGDVPTSELHKFTPPPEDVMSRLNLTPTQYLVGIKFAADHGFLPAVILVKLDNKDNKVQ